MRWITFVALLFVAVTLDAQQITTIHIPGATSVEFGAMSSNGLIAGTFFSASGTHGFLRDKNGHITVFDVITPEGPAEEIQPTAVNDKGQIVGSALPAMPSNQIVALYSFLRDVDGTITVFSFPNAFYTIPVGIDAKGDVVGSWQGPNGVPPHGWVRMADGTLTELLPNGYSTVMPDAITPGGQISGIYYANGSIQTFVEKLPNPERE